jgi:acetyl esterase
MTAPHAQIQPFLTAAEALPSFADMTPTGAREFVLQMSAAMPKVALPEIGGFEKFTIPGPGGSLSIHHYQPKQTPARGAVVYFHGGGWVIGTPEFSEGLCRILVNASGCEIFSVDYRLAPEHPFPAPIEDAYAAVTWAAKRSTAPLFVGGDSAGGNLAAACAIRAREAGGPRLSGQMLFYPVTDHDFDTPSYRAYGTKKWMLSTADMKWFWHHYVADPERRNDPLASPLRAKSLANLAPALVVVPGLDPLCSEGEAYAARLKADGTPVELRTYDDMVHGFLGMIGLADIPRQAAEAAGQWLAAQLPKARSA